MHQEIVALNAKIAALQITKLKRIDEMRALVREIKSRYQAVDGLFRDHDPRVLETAFQEPGSIDRLVDDCDS